MVTRPAQLLKELFIVEGQAMVLSSVGRCACCMVIRIHPQCALSRLPSFQDHLVLETLPPFRIILHWTTLW